uniref:Uncharacterized protein n=1 Tax=Ovis aries TaxID=9940 RepID=A0AC11DBB3_SHEEP
MSSVERKSQLSDLEEEEQIFILDCVEQFLEASQQTAELSEVLALRMENYEQQWREVAQLQGRVMKLQRCSRSVCRGVCRASSSCHSPLESMSPSPCPHPGDSA